MRIARRTAVTVAVCLGAMVLSLTAPASAVAAGPMSRAGAALPSRAVQVRTLGAALPSRAAQVRTLEAALAHLHADYGELYRRFSPGPDDILGYGIGALWSRGIDGAGTTVALLEGWRDPFVSQVLARFDHAYDLPTVHLSSIYPAGALPASCPHQMLVLGSYGSCYDWRYELELDVESVHLIAPYARILLVVAPADRDADAAEGVAPPEMLEGVEDVSRHHLANVISVSDGSGESTYRHGRAEIVAQDPGELAAAAAGIPFVGGTGDCGAAQALAVNQQTGCAHVTHFRDSTTWADSPWVTAVGGSVPDLNPRTGARLGPDHLWRVNTGLLIIGAGAGRSTVFARPAYQNGVASIIHSRMRSVPDITMDASDGTSQATPLFAGVLALATQENGGRDLGPVNPALYALGPEGTRAGIVDVTGGNDTFRDPGERLRVPGFSAVRGFDVASGWGTVNAPVFVPSLVAMTRRMGEESAARASASAGLRALENHSLRVQSVGATSTTGGAELQVDASGLLPEFPVSLSIAGRVVVHLRANAQGRLEAELRLPGLTLAPGPHAATLTGLLITETARFSTS
jgi:hypothetical protein